MPSPATALIAAIDLRGRYREPFSNWEAATDAPPARLRGDLELLAAIAEAGLSRAAKDISQGGIVGTAVMLAECSGVAIDIDLDAVPNPAGVALERWLLTFPSFGYLLSVEPGMSRNRRALCRRAASRCGRSARSRRAAASPSATAHDRADLGLRREAADRRRTGAAGEGAVA